MELLDIYAVECGFEMEIENIIESEKVSVLV